MHNALVSCKAGYGIVDKPAVYTYCSTNGKTGTLRTAQNGGGNEVSCEQQFYEWRSAEFDEGTTNIIPSIDGFGNYNMIYLTVRYGVWWEGCRSKPYQGDCWKICYGTDKNCYETNNGKWTLIADNEICGDPVPYCVKKAKVWVGYCLRGNLSSIACLETLTEKFARRNSNLQ